jgi:hypothetical protein
MTQQKLINLPVLAQILIREVERPLMKDIVDSGIRIVEQLMDNRVEQTTEGAMDNRVEGAMDNRVEGAMDNRVEEAMDNRVEVAMDNRVEGAMDNQTMVVKVMDNPVEAGILDKVLV